MPPVGQITEVGGVLHPSLGAFGYFFQIVAGAGFGTCRRPWNVGGYGDYPRVRS